MIRRSIAVAGSRGLKRTLVRGCCWSDWGSGYNLVELEGVVLADAADDFVAGVETNIVNCLLVSLMSELHLFILTKSSSVPPKSLGISNPTLIKSHTLTFLSADPLTNTLPPFTITCGWPATNRGTSHCPNVPRIYADVH